MGVLGLCPASTVDFEDACVRESWAALLPAVLVAAYLLLSLPLPAPLRQIWDYIIEPFRTYITLPEAEAVLSGASVASAAEVRYRTTRATPAWRTAVLCACALIPALAWAGLASFALASRSEDITTWTLIQPFLPAAAWAYAAILPVLNSRPTPAYELFALYVLQLICGVLVLGGALFDARLGDALHLSKAVLMGHIADVVASLLLLLVSLSTPIALPSERVEKAEIGKSVSPEDYTSLWGWISFAWVTPLVASGTTATLNEQDIWALSPTLQSKAIFGKFAALQRKTLLRRLWAANSLDVLLDFGLTFVSVVFNYAGPFFLNRILAAISSGEPEARAKAYVYAVLALFCTIAKAESDVNHLWYGRRASTRVRSELMAAIYEKALKRRDFSGIVDQEKAEKTKAKDTSKPDDENKAGADVAKIVNLMSGDANVVSMIISGMYFIYSAPMEIVIALAFLYQLLGPSAFAGLAVLALMWPANSYVTRRSIRIQKGVLAARDKRMGVLNELIGAVKFIKFFAWEDRWIDRALEARAFEMKWMVKARTNSVAFTALWTTAPVLVSLISFATFVALGHKLDVATAFTALALFGMIRQPLNVIPMWIVQILQTLVALNRISVYLAEEEVSPQVSSLKREGRPAAAELEEGLGFEAASFKWNEIEAQEEDKSKKDKKKGKKRQPSPPVSEATDIDEPQPRFELRDLSVRFPEGKLTVVTGPTASGKTALLLALLGEMTPLGGRLFMAKDLAAIDPATGLVHGISYAAQSPWLRHQSIKDNILFGQPLDEERYEAVIEACALRTDLLILEDGDDTEIGARGVSLSGGQKARVALARAVYARTKYVLLDDPLSAVDSHTARFLFETLLCGPLLAGRTVILITHHVELVLPGAHYLLRMLDGRIDTHGPVNELRTAGVLDDITHAEAAEAAAQDIAQAQAAGVGEAEAAAGLVVEGDAGIAAAEAKDAAKNVASKKPRKLIEQEKREEGSVKWKIYKTYLQASSYWTWGILAVLIICSQSFGVSEKLWIRVWGRAYSGVSTSAFTLAPFSAAEYDPDLNSHMTASILHTYPRQHTLRRLPSLNLPDANVHPIFYVGVYAAIGLGSALVTVLSSIVQYTGALKASRRMFKQLLVGVVRATMRWHDTTPQGRMLNRFSKDVETVDSSLASSLQAVTSSLANFLASILTISIIFPPFLFPVTAIGYIYYSLASGYLNTGRDLRRMESNTRSPIFSGFSELLEGIVTVRAFSAETRFLNDLHNMIDLTTKLYYATWMTNRWLLLRFDILGGLTVFITTLLALSGVVDAGLAGVCITSAMSFTMGVYWACRFWTALELDLNSVERVVEYLDLPQEPPAVIENSRPPAYWPSANTNNALIKVEDLVVRYAPELPPVLHGISFELRAKERVGLLGRTGSGKSTLAMSVLRFVDPASGRILIDGIDITSIGVHDLRSRLTFIPQDATLFSGTLRENLDPFNEHSDAECLDVLNRVGITSDSTNGSQRTSRVTSRAPSIKDSADVAPSSLTSESGIDTLADGEGRVTVTLESTVSAGGANFSQGQRQLIALARALLRRAAIIVLDEATSSIDFASDARIQATIREEFTDSLLLTVAHRLKTVIDYDRLIVLDKGTIAECDTPLALIQKEDGVFRQMCMQSGMFAELEAAARAKADTEPEAAR